MRKGNKQRTRFFQMLIGDVLKDRNFQKETDVKENVFSVSSGFYPGFNRY